jgi:hypothetical protein
MSGNFKRIGGADLRIRDLGMPFPENLRRCPTGNPLRKLCLSAHRGGNRGHDFA